MSSYIQWPYGVIDKEPKLNIGLPKNYATRECFSRLPNIDNIDDTKAQNEAVNLINTGADLKNFLLATSDYGESIQDNINNLVTDGEYSNAALRHVLDEKKNPIFKTANLLSVTFKNANKFDLQNPVLGNILSQVGDSQLTEKQLNKLLQQGEDKNIRARLDALKKYNASLRDSDGNNNDDNTNNTGPDDDFGRFPPPPFPPPDSKPWRRKGPIGRRSPPSPGQPKWIPYLPNPKPIPAPRSDFSMKNGLKPPKPPKRRDIPPFISDVEALDDEDGYLPPPDLPKFDVSFDRPKTKLVDAKKTL